MNYINLIEKYQGAIAQARAAIIKKKDGTVLDIDQEQVKQALVEARKYNIQISNKVNSKNFNIREDEIDGIEETIIIHEKELRFIGGNSNFEK